MFRTDNLQMILGVTIFIVKLVLLLVGIGYFGAKAKDSTLSIARKTFIVCTVIAVLKIVGATLGNFTVVTQGSASNFTLKFMVTLFFIALASYLNVIYLRTGQHLAKEKSLLGSLYLTGAKWVNLDVKLMLSALSGLLLWSSVIFYLFKPEVSNTFGAILPEHVGTIQLVYILLNITLIAPIIEEIFFRHFSMGIFAKWFGVNRIALLLNIGLTSIFFSLYHLNMLTNNWVKMVQIFPLGVVLGVVYVKKGLEHSIVLHLLFNLAAFFLFSFASFQ